MGQGRGMGEWRGGGAGLEVGLLALSCASRSVGLNGHGPPPHPRSLYSTHHSLFHISLFPPHINVYTIHHSLLHTSLFTPHITNYTAHHSLLHTSLFTPHIAMYTTHHHTPLFTPHTTLYPKRPPISLLRRSGDAWCKSGVWCKEIGGC